MTYNRVYLAILLGLLLIATREFSADAYMRIEPQKSLIGRFSSTKSMIPSKMSFVSSFWKTVLPSLLLSLNIFYSPLASIAATPEPLYDPSLEVRILPPPVKTQRPLAYSVEMGDPQYLQPRTKKGEESLLKRLVGSQILLFGEHSKGTKEAKDVALQIELLNRMLKIKPKQQMILAAQALPQNEKIDQALREFVLSKPSKEANEEQEVF